MVHVSGQRSTGFHTSLLMAPDVVMATVCNTNYQPVTWARTREDLETMNRRVEESLEIASFCQEVRSARRVVTWDACIQTRNYLFKLCVITVDNSCTACEGGGTFTRSLRWMWTKLHLSNRIGCSVWILDNNESTAVSWNTTCKTWIKKIRIPSSCLIRKWGRELAWVCLEVMASI